MASIGLAAALASYFIMQAPCVVVDLGTAVTVDWVDQYGTFRGGAIVPGRKLMGKALALGTDRLPEISSWDDPEPPLHLPGLDTHSAIRNGIEVGFSRFVDGLVEDLLQQEADEVGLVLTGGDAEWYLRRSQFEFHCEPNLVVKGLWCGANLSE